MEPLDNGHTRILFPFPFLVQNITSQVSNVLLRDNDEEFQLMRNASYVLRVSPHHLCSMHMYVPVIQTYNMTTMCICDYIHNFAHLYLRMYVCQCVCIHGYRTHTMNVCSIYLRMYMLYIPLAHTYVVHCCMLVLFSSGLCYDQLWSISTK